MDSISSEKIKLMQILTEIRTTSYNLQLCSLLIETQKIYDEYNAKEKHFNRSFQDHLKYDKQVSCDIKKILIHEPAERLVKNIFKVLCPPTENLYEEEQQLLNSQLMSECEECPAEYLNQLIETLENLMKLIFRRDLYFYCFGLLVEDYERNLDTLKAFMLLYGKNKVRGLFSRMFFIGISKLDFSLEEKKEIGDLMLGAMPYIQTFIKDFSLDFESGVGIIRLQKRSALQFIKDLLIEYSAEYGTLRELIGTLDAIMKYIDEAAAKCDVPLSTSDRVISDEDDESDYEIYPDCDFDYETLDEFNDAGANKVPEEHTWWQVYKKANFK